MRFANPDVDIYIPDGADVKTALKRVNGGRLGIGAHQDDLEIFAVHGIGQCYGRSDKMFAGVTVTDGSGSPRKGKYAPFTDAQMITKRHEEQRQAAAEGKYAVQFQLRYKSGDIKGPNPPRGKNLAEDIQQILLETQPATVYLHNPFDKHETHNAVTRAALQALRKLPSDRRPERIYGCEVWRGLDWLPDSLKVPLDISAYQDLQKRLIKCHDSQVAGSKGYVEATLGRELANATYLDTHALDAAEAVIYAVDLMSLVKDKSLTLEAFTQQHLQAFAGDLVARAKIYEVGVQSS